jgi:hypothetical protein
VQELARSALMLARSALTISSVHSSPPIRLFDCHCTSVVCRDTTVSSFISGHVPALEEQPPSAGTGEKRPHAGEKPPHDIVSALQQASNQTLRLSLHFSSLLGHDGLILHKWPCPRTRGAAPKCRNWREAPLCWREAPSRYRQCTPAGLQSDSPPSSP